MQKKTKNPETEKWDEKTKKEGNIENWNDKKNKQRISLAYSLLYCTRIIVIIVIFVAMFGRRKNDVRV